jgi:hypothetical protein
MVRETIRTPARTGGMYGTSAVIKLDYGVPARGAGIERRGAELRDSRGENQREYKEPRPRL